MAEKTAVPKLPPSYFKLVRQFPLLHIRDDDHLDAAQAVLNRLLGEDLDEGGREYLDALTDLVEAYEDEHVPMGDASASDVLAELMRSNGLSAAELGKKVKIPAATLSAVLAGERSLTKTQVAALAGYFGISSGAFLPR